MNRVFPEWRLLSFKIDKCSIERVIGVGFETMVKHHFKNL